MMEFGEAFATCHGRQLKRIRDRAVLILLLVFVIARVLVGTQLPLAQDSGDHHEYHRLSQLSFFNLLRNHSREPAYPALLSLLGEVDENSPAYRRSITMMNTVLVVAGFVLLALLPATLPMWPLPRMVAWFAVCFGMSLSAFALLWEWAFRRESLIFLGQMLVIYLLWRGGKGKLGWLSRRPLEWWWVAFGVSALFCLTSAIFVTLTLSILLVFGLLGASRRRVFMNLCVGLLLWAGCFAAVSRFNSDRSYLAKVNLVNLKLLGDDRLRGLLVPMLPANYERWQGVPFWGEVDGERFIASDDHHWAKQNMGGLVRRFAMTHPVPFAACLYHNASDTLGDFFIRGDEFIVLYATTVQEKNEVLGNTPLPMWARKTCILITRLVTFPVTAATWLFGQSSPALLGIVTTALTAILLRRRISSAPIPLEFAMLAFFAVHASITLVAALSSDGCEDVRHALPGLLSLTLLGGLTGLIGLTAFWSKRHALGSMIPAKQARCA